VRTLVAIKSVNLGKLNKKLKDNLTSEISILKGLHHPHIVALIDCKDTASHIHLVMEYVALGDLSYFIKKRDSIKSSPMVGNMMAKYPNPVVGGLHEVVVRHFFQQLASALKFLRDRNLIHRDVKPQNLLLSPSPDYFENSKPEIMPYLASDDSLVPICGIRSLPMLKIADFGFARSLPSTSLAETLCGSPLYMAPEILRYEKYDAKADLWSVGTVLYEMMTSKPPFRASNHVELLRKIEKGEDKIKFPDEIAISSAVKKLIRGLLKRDPKERMSFSDFFDNEILHTDIPGLQAEDKPHTVEITTSSKEGDRRRGSRTDPIGLVTRPGSRRDVESPYTEAYRDAVDADIRPPHVRTPERRPSTVTSRPSTARRLTNDDIRPGSSEQPPTSPLSQRPSLRCHDTAPARQELQHKNPVLANAAMDRQATAAERVRGPSLIGEQVQDRDRDRAQRTYEENERERAAQDIAFERDYVLVEKRAVEVNALADELEASPKLNRGAPQSLPTPHSGAMVRRATTQGNPTPTTGAQTSASRAVQIASGRPRPDMMHQRQGSYERRYGPGPASATSAISKALTMASGRLFGFGVSPPVPFARTGRSPPIGYSPFPTYPAAQSSLVVVGESTRSAVLDEDTKFVQSIEEVATRSDVVYGFAEVKYRQLTPSHPSADVGDLDDGLTVEAVVIVAEEALVLYVKALSLLAKSMDIAARWWARKNRGEVLGEHSISRTGGTSSANGTRMNNVVQWIRSRFNEVLEKAELVRLKLIDNQRRLPEDHPSHPNNISATTGSSTGLGTSADHIVVSSGITAEKLMYDRALEMSRSAAINELTGEDLTGCEISYITAIRMLEAVLETDEDLLSRKGSGSSNDRSGKESNDDDLPINGMEAEDRKTVRNRKSNHLCDGRNLLTLQSVVSSIRNRLAALRKKLQVIHKRASAPAINSPSKVSPSPPSSHRGSVPRIATTPPR
jgi:serine/threonine-protein kinase ULK/ATG1